MSRPASAACHSSSSASTYASAFCLHSSASSSPPFPTRLRHPTTRYPTTRPTVHPPVIAASTNLTQPLPPSDEPYFQRLTPPPRDLWPLEFSSRAPLPNFPSLSFLPSSHLFFFASRFHTHGSIILPSSSVHPSIYLSIRRIARVARIRHGLVEFFIRVRQDNANVPRNDSIIPSSFYRQTDTMPRLLIKPRSCFPV